MFLVGVFMGAGVILRTGSTTNDLATSVYQWVNIDGHVLLLVFLPGLLFKDAFEVNFHLFRASFWQLLTMSFPMVLAGTCLVALIGWGVFPYGWSWALSMTFGAILAATDPVAVSALLNEVGAPPRLKMHVSGEILVTS
jgi:NhaP-type Na+/H+ or K+/H+ antiporter